MPPAAVFVFYLIALLALSVAALWPLFKREPYTPVSLIALGLALVTLVWTWQAGATAF